LRSKGRNPEIGFDAPERLWHLAHQISIPALTMSTRRFTQSLAATVAFVAATAAPLLAQTTLLPYWTVPTTGATTFPDTGNLTRGGAFNPSTGNLLVATRAGGTSVRVLNGATGAEVGTLNLTGVSGGTFALNTVGVGADGAIYGANLVTDSLASPFKVYRWANESAEPTVVYSGNPSGAVAGRYGDTFAVRGGGATTEIIAGQGTTAAGSTRLFYLGTADGAAFTGKTFTVDGLSAGDLRLALDFGVGNTVLGKQGGALRLVGYDLGAGTASVLSSFTLGVPNAGGTAGAFDIGSGYLASYGFQGANGAAQSINLYDFASLTTTGSNLPIDQELLATAVGNGNGVGAVALSADGSVVYVVAPNNGVSAFRIVPEPGTWVLLVAGSALLGFTTLRRRA
jgi:hypothetical protein